MIDKTLKDYKSLYLCVSGGADSALGLYTIAKYITENKLDTKVTVVMLLNLNHIIAETIKMQKKCYQ